MRAAHVSSAIEDIPVDFFGDPDGCWDYDQLERVAAFAEAGLDPAAGQISIGALTAPYAGFPDGAAVVMFTSSDQRAIALVDCVGSSSHFAINDGQAEVRSELENELPGAPRNDSWGSALDRVASSKSVAGAFVGDAFGRDVRRNDVAA